jgi:uncharacterized membrane protein YqjE
MAVLFGFVAGIIVMKVRASMNAEAPLLSATLAELRNDVAYLRQGVAYHTGAADE